MKFVSFRDGNAPGWGALLEGGIVALGARLGVPTLRAALAAGLPTDLASTVAAITPDHALADVTLETPVPDAAKIVCIGRNYRGHVAEGNQALPKTPSTFIRTHQSFVAPGAALVRPKLSEQFDYEGELALVIGKAGRHIAAADAFDHIAGYTCLQEGSIRDFQFDHCLTIGKNFDATGSIGPVLVTIDEIPDVSSLVLSTRLNGVEVQRSQTNDFIFNIPAIIAYLSSVMALVPGDIISTGTPEGVGFARKPPLWLKPGDKVEVEIAGIGILRNTVVAE